MRLEEEILDLPEDKPDKAKRGFKVWRIVALFFFILALLFRFNKWAGQTTFLLLGALLFCIWAILMFLFTKDKKAFDWLYFLGRVGLGVGLAFRFVWNAGFSPYLVYASIASVAVAFWLHSRSADNS